jgi:hypothetical protein
VKPQDRRFFAIAIIVTATLVTLAFFIDLLVDDRPSFQPSPHPAFPTFLILILTILNLVAWPSAAVVILTHRPQSLLALGVLLFFFVCAIGYLAISHTSGPATVGFSNASLAYASRCIVRARLT